MIEGEGEAALIHEVGDLFDVTPTGAVFPRDQVRLLAPCTPGKIVCVGLNYRSHTRDGYTLPQEPILFLKPPSAASGPDAAIPFPAQSRQVDFEGELALVIGTPGYQLTPEEAPAHILGYCCANDVTARDIQEREQNFGRAKSFCGFAPFGPWIDTAFDPADFTLETRLNGELKQCADALDLLFTPAQLVAFISQVMPLVPGDLILTGTPRGMGPMRPGDRVEVTISGLGSLENTLENTLENSLDSKPRSPAVPNPNPIEEVPHGVPS